MVKRESTAKRNEAPIVEDVEEDVNNNLRDIEVPMNNKINDTFTRKK